MDNGPAAAQVYPKEESINTYVYRCTMKVEDRKELKGQVHLWLIQAKCTPEI